MTSSLPGYFWSPSSAEAIMQLHTGLQLGRCAGQQEAAGRTRMARLMTFLAWS